MALNTQPKPDVAKKQIVNRAKEVLEKLSDSALVAEIVESKIKDGDHPLYAQALGDEVRRRIKALRLKALRAKQA
jgi:hypothetical protein